VGSWIDGQLGALDGLKGEACEWLAGQTKDAALATELLGQVDGTCTAMLSSALESAKPVEGGALDERLNQPIEKGVRELDALLAAEWPDWKERSGLVLVTAADGTSEWVLPEDADAFKSEGKKMLGKKSVEDRAPIEAAQQAAAAQQDHSVAAAAPVGVVAAPDVVGEGGLDQGEVMLQLVAMEERLGAQLHQQVAKASERVRMSADSAEAPCCSCFPWRSHGRVAADDAPPEVTTMERVDQRSSRVIH